jgi:hypothetical protein
MSCRIKLYETGGTSPPSHVSLRSATVHLVAVEQASLTNCCQVQVNKRLIGGGYGADLPFIPASFVYQVAIVDTAQTYAGATVTNLNGATPGDLEVVLFCLPTSRVEVIASSGTAAHMRDAVIRHPSWSADEKQAILSVMNALGSLRGTTTPLVLEFIARYERIMADVGINPAFF